MKNHNRKLLPLAILTSMAASLLSCSQVLADQVILDDLIVDGSICVGMDCVNGESFGFDTIRLKENNLRIRFVDSSNSSSFPSRDWQITVNDSANGGANKFSIDDIDGSLTPFTIEAGAPSHSLYVDDGGRIGVGTSTPVVDLHIKSGNTPTLRLEQDGSSGFAAQTWDIASNETNFFIRDATNGSTLPFRIFPSAPKSSLHIAADGDIGLSTETPDGLLDVAHSSNGNNHALLIDPSSNVGINIDNSQTPNGLFDVQTGAGKSGFLVQADGNVGFGTGTTAIQGRFDVRSLDNNQYYLNVNDIGNVGIGTNAPGELLEVNGAGLMQRLSLYNSGTKGGALWISDKEGDLKWVIDDHEKGLRFRQTGFTNQMVFDAGTGNIGFGTGDPEYPLHHSSGAHLTTGGVWTDASSREFKKGITNMSLTDATLALKTLNPVTFQYKTEPDETYAGFIAEDVPDLVATSDRKGLAAMDIVAVLTKVLKNQQATIKTLNERLSKLENSNKH